MMVVSVSQRMTDSGAFFCLVMSGSSRFPIQHRAEPLPGGLVNPPQPIVTFAHPDSIKTLCIGQR